MPGNVEIVGPTTAQLGQSIGEWVRQNTIAVADNALIDYVGRGFDNQPVVITDGVPRRDPRQVKPFGRIEFARRTSVAEAVLWALAELRRRSPVLTGHYRDSHIVLVNGEQVVGDIRAALMRLQPLDRVQIVNTAIYARKLEGATASKRTGRTKRRALSAQARGGIYRPVLRALLQRFGRVMFFDFTYSQLNTGAKVWGLQGGGKNRPKVQRNQVYPTLKFFQKPAGQPN